MPTGNRMGIILLVLSGVAWLVLSAQCVQAATVMLRVGTVQVAAGSTVEVPIEAVGAPGIGPLHLELVYDPTVLLAQQVSRGPLLTNALLESNVSKQGRVVIGLVAADAIKGDGVVIKVRFKAVGNQGQQSALTLDLVKAWERGNGRDVLVTTEAGRATVLADFTMWFIVAGACLGLFILLLGGVGLILRRGRRPQPQYAAQPNSAPSRYPPPPSRPVGPGKPGGAPPPTDLPR